MRKGFTFDAALCVSCKACSAACILENGLQPGTRSLFAWNGHALPLVNVINLSMACNHCADPACASGCPALAYTIGPDGIVIHHPDRCMGCGYCTWRCPYDAPKINTASGIIEKCHFCADRTTEGIGPACVTACPTGALKMTETEDFDGMLPAWFPDTGIKPSFVIRNAEKENRPHTIPADNEAYAPDNEDQYSDQSVSSAIVRLKKEWSLVLFSLLVIAASVMLVINELTNRTALSGSWFTSILPLLLTAGAMAVSAVHLGRPGRSYRAVLNILRSPLSREIVMVMLLGAASLVSWLKPGMIPLAVTAAIAVMSVIAVDLVYFAADRSFSLRLHTGQAFFTALYAVTWFTEPRLLFIIFSMITAVSVVLRYGSAERGEPQRTLYYLRAMSLPLVFLLIYPGNPVTDLFATLLFFAGLVADRLLFYLDFNPPDIKETIRKHFNTEYEKERDKQRKDTGLS
ncbi:MAG: 4Fe-4S binding protein [Bacteroidales bacterium]|jgi:Fe-S-cluster-containing dehydrogenase component/DMSO reductase anchor subunit|nr:4Fe-4S binding protein [Bacteroidales bacterium]